jgi:hypothetical protein
MKLLLTFVALATCQ